MCFKGRAFWLGDPYGEALGIWSTRRWDRGQQVIEYKTWGCVGLAVS